MSLNRVTALTRPAREEQVCLRLHQIADMVGGRILNGEDPWITGAAGIEDASSGDLTFLGDSRYRAALKTTSASAVLIRESEKTKLPAVVVDDPALAFMIVLRRFAASISPQYPPNVHETAVIDPSVNLGRDVHIGPNVVIEPGAEIGDRSVLMAGCVIMRDTTLGEDAVLYPNVVIRERVEIGKRVIVYPGAVIGSDGFGFVKEAATLHKVPHIGTVVIEDDVEIGANACIDRATTGVTRIERSTKIDNLVQIAHNVRIGPHCIICAQVGISGSTRVGTGVRLAGQVGIVGHIEIGDGATLGAQAGVTRSVPAGETYSGYPARSHRREMRQLAALSLLPETINKIRELQDRLQALEDSQERER